jgi:hypothetical protein
MVTGPNPSFGISETVPATVVPVEVGLVDGLGDGCVTVPLAGDVDEPPGVGPEPPPPPHALIANRSAATPNARP